MPRHIRLIATVALLWSATAMATEKGREYLKDGKLTDRLMIYQLQGGFAGFTGDYHLVETDGTWSTGSVMNGKRSEPKAKGQLTADQLVELAKALAKHDLANLPSHGKVQVNPRVTEVFFGKKSVQLNPISDGSKEDKAIRARYKGIVVAVKAVCIVKKK